MANEWGNNGNSEKLFIFLSSKIIEIMTAAMKLRHLLLRRKAMTNLDSILRTRDITLPTNVHLVKALVFPVVRYGCESWTIIKKAESWRIDAFELWCWRKLLRVSWTARRSNQSILKEIISIQFSYSVMSNCWLPHRLQHTRLPCPSPSSGTCSNSCPLSWWCHLTISSSVVPFSSCLQSFTVSQSFPMSQFFASDSQSIEVSASASVLPIIFRTDFLSDGLVDLLAVQGTLKSLLQYRSSKSLILQHSAFFIVQLSHPYITTGKP